MNSPCESTNKSCGTWRARNSPPPLPPIPIRSRATSEIDAFSVVEDIELTLAHLPDLMGLHDEDKAKLERVLLDALAIARRSAPGGAENDRKMASEWKRRYEGQVVLTQSAQATNESYSEML